jgi:hypothetical protein
MTCWSCHRELAGHWRACPACGALSLANVEAVARGVASMAVRVRVRECRVNGCENVWRANTNGAAGHKHPTRHGAALAAFDAAWGPAWSWSEGLGLHRVRVDLAQPLGKARPSESMSHGFGRRYMGMPDTHPGWCTCDHPQCPGAGREQLTVASPDEDREPPSLWPRGIEAEGCPVVGGQALDDADTIAQWCEEMGGKLVYRDSGEFDVWATKHRALRARGLSELRSVCARLSIPQHVADAMVREARRALGEGL